MKEKGKTTGEKITNFLFQLQPSFPLPEGVSIMHPYKDRMIREISDAFYSKYYNDNNPRILILAINPGRLGAGITGIPFTDPVRLEEKCGIANNLPKKKELSGGFIYEMMENYGGVEKFYHQFLLSSLCPLGFIKDAKNVNYYDTKQLQKAATPFIIETLWKQKDMTQSPDVCICLGTGKNFNFFKRLNQEHHFFKKIYPLAHPRYILQYKRKQKEEYIRRYLERLNDRSDGSKPSDQ